MPRPTIAEQPYCALCGILLPRTSQPSIVTIGRGQEAQMRLVCSDSDGCRRRAIDIVRELRALLDRKLAE